VNSGNLASKLITGPIEEPVTRDEVKTHLKIALAFTDDDAYLDMQISAARWQAEMFTRCAFLTQTWQMTLDRFPYGDGLYNRNIEHHCIRVIRPPLQSINFVKYLDPGGALQTLAPSSYVVDTFSQPGRITTAIGVPWPATGRLPNAVQIELIAGSADTTAHALAADPGFNAVKMAILHLVGHWYVNREPVVQGQVVTLPLHVQSLLLSKRAQGF
jgi:uncharacterized phiE125 gp8 family phage protein